jgi:membrane-associated phospholipid phosphatase
MTNQFETSGVYMRLFFAGICLYWAAGLGWLIMYSKAAGFLLMRSLGNHYTDFFFRYVTHIGDGLAAIALCIFWVFRKKMDVAFVLFVGYALSGLMAQAIKHSVVMPRPAPYFKVLGENIRAIDGVELLQSNTSFPSGHTATAFALATALVLMNSWWSKRWWLALLIAILIGYSRIYLGQHFMQDVLAGSVLGTLATLAGWLVLKKWNPPFARHL